MDTRTIVETARAIRDALQGLLPQVWPGFAMPPFILYDHRLQAAVGGEDWPEQYVRQPSGVWMAEGGTDPLLMGCAYADYHGRPVAIWDTRIWDEGASVADMAADVAHEMFHVHQVTQLHTPYPNELLLPDYPHSDESVALLLEENRLLLDAVYSDNRDTSLHALSQIEWLRVCRAELVDQRHMEYDCSAETIEGTAAYVQAMVGVLLHRVDTLRETKRFLHWLDAEQALRKYRHGRYASGLLQCLLLDRFAPGWKDAWDGRTPLFQWLVSRLGLQPVEAVLPALAVRMAAERLKRYTREKEQEIERYQQQPLLKLDGNITVERFDPMNLVCANHLCLHKGGVLRLGNRTIRFEEPFLAEYGEHILDVKALWLANADARPLANGNIEVGDLGELCGLVTVALG